jgi:hypothetical protein
VQQFEIYFAKRKAPVIRPGLKGETTMKKLASTSKRIL